MSGEPNIQVQLSSGQFCVLGKEVWGVWVKGTAYFKVCGILRLVGPEGFYVSPETDETFPVCVAAFFEEVEADAFVAQHRKPEVEPAPVRTAAPAEFWMIANIMGAERQWDHFENLGGYVLAEQHKPKFMHETEDSADRELLRLASAHPDGQFVKLQAVGWAEGRQRQTVETVTEYFVEKMAPAK